MTIDRIDRILLAYESDDLPAELLAAVGVTPADAAAAVSLARLDLEAERAANGTSVRDIVRSFLSQLGDDER